jgi:hypothetical protein
VTGVIGPLDLRDWPSALWRNILDNRGEGIRRDKRGNKDRQEKFHYNGVTDLSRC